MRTSFFGCTWERCVSVGNAKNDAYGKNFFSHGFIGPKLHFHYAKKGIMKDVHHIDPNKFSFSEFLSLKSKIWPEKFKLDEDWQKLQNSRIPTKEN